MTINQADHIADNRRRQSLMAAGGLLGALAASSCCILPLALLGLRISGAWIGNFTRLAPYQPCFIGVTVAFLGYGYWLVYRSSTRACADGAACAPPAEPHRQDNRPLHRPTWNQAGCEGRVDWSGTADDAQVRGQPGRYAARSIRRNSRGCHRRSFAALEGPQHGVLRLQQAGRQDLGRSPRVVLAAGMMAGLPASYFCVRAFSETDFTEDLKKFDVPTLILQGDDDQIVPYADAALLSAKLIKSSKLKIIKGAPHGVCTT